MSAAKASSGVRASAVKKPQGPPVAGLLDFSFYQSRLWMFFGYPLTSQTKTRRENEHKIRNSKVFRKHSELQPQFWFIFSKITQMITNDSPTSTFKVKESSFFFPRERSLSPRTNQVIASGQRKLKSPRLPWEDGHPLRVKPIVSPSWVVLLWGNSTLWKTSVSLCKKA